MRWDFCSSVLDIVVDQSRFTPPLDFGPFTLDLVPQWYRDHGRHLIDPFERLAGLALSGSYESADEPFKVGATPPQEQMQERCACVPLAVWCIQPCGFCFSHIMHRESPIGKDDDSSALLYQRIDVIKCLPDQRGVKVGRHELEQAVTIFHAMDELPRNGTLWAAIRVLRKALAETMWDLRIVLLWVALEALFGVDDKGEQRFRLSTSLALFLSGDPSERRKIAAEAKKLYDVRSKVVHGSRSAGIDTEGMIADCRRVEDLVRRSLVKILLGPHRADFDSRRRQDYLAELLLGG